jgi:glyoxylase-like metal-dependent hydrolase (beta-lactamase superfamily II)
MDRAASDSAVGAWQRLGERVFVCVCEPESVNAGLVLGNRHALLIDVGSNPEQGSALTASVEREFGRQIDRVVITHAHYDHWFGLAGVPEHAKAFGQVGLLQEAEELLSGDDAFQFGFSPELVIAPQNLIREYTSLSLGGVKVWLRHFGPAHSNTDLVAILPDSGFAFVGDLIETNGPPQFGPDSTVSGWPGALDQLLSFTSANTIFIPGHGGPVSVETVRTQRDQIAELYQRVTMLQRSGLGLQEVLTQIDDSWPFDMPTVKSAAIATFAEVGELAGNSL